MKTVYIIIGALLIVGVLGFPRPDDTNSDSDESDESGGDDGRRVYYARNLNLHGLEEENFDVLNRQEKREDVFEEMMQQTHQSEEKGQEVVADKKGDSKENTEELEPEFLHSSEFPDANEAIAPVDLGLSGENQKHSGENCPDSKEPLAEDTNQHSEENIWGADEHVDSGRETDPNEDDDSAQNALGADDGNDSALDLLGADDGNDSAQSPLDANDGNDSERNDDEEENSMNEEEQEKLDNQSAPIDLDDPKDEDTSDQDKEEHTGSVAEDATEEKKNSNESPDIDPNSVTIPPPRETSEEPTTAIDNVNDLVEKIVAQISQETGIPNADVERVNIINALEYARQLNQVEAVDEAIQSMLLKLIVDEAEKQQKDQLIEVGTGMLRKGDTDENKGDKDENKEDRKKAMEKLAEHILGIIAAV